MRFLLIFLALTGFSCSHKNTQEITQKYSTELQQDTLTLDGTWNWSFALMGGTQHSVHQFMKDSIVYSMKGPVYSTSYTMHQLSYEKDEQKWIGQDNKGKVYVLFFKPNNDSTLSLYKHACKTSGLEEALSFSKPAPDATEDHGWNQYVLSGSDQEDILSWQGNYTYNASILYLSDSIVKINDDVYSKYSYHAGERRWVGKKEALFVQLFIGNTAPGDSFQLSIQTFNNEEKMYRTKYREASFDWVHVPE